MPSQNVERAERPFLDVRIISFGHRAQHLTDIRRFAYWDARLKIEGDKISYHCFVYGGIPRLANGRRFIRFWAYGHRYSGWMRGNHTDTVLTLNRCSVHRDLEPIIP